MASRPLNRIDLGDRDECDASDGGNATIDLRVDRPAVAED